VTYWIAREHWGKGIATKALGMFLRDARMQRRPLNASAARDNIASLRVLEQCGFVLIGYEKAFANARGKEIEEAMFVLA
jgi:RimJ/RimL family protein N-acetyltransferase